MMSDEKRHIDTGQRLTHHQVMWGPVSYSRSQLALVYADQL